MANVFEFFVVFRESDIQHVFYGCGVRSVKSRIASDSMVNSVFERHGVTVLVVKFIKDVFDHRSSVIFIHDSSFFSFPSNFVDLLFFGKVSPLSFEQVLESVILDSDGLVEHVLVINVGCSRSPGLVFVDADGN